MAGPRIRDRVDIAIMGAGAAGSYLACRFAEAGLEVVVLEAGPAWQLSDLTSSQIWARRLKWGGAPVLSGGEHPIGHNMATGWGLGGAALHHYAGWPRLHPEDFRMKALYGRGRDWPMTYEDLRPHYDHIQEEVGISGDAAAEIWRPSGDPYPMPPLEWFRQGEILKRGFEAMGRHVAPAPMAVNSVWYKGRSPCVYDGWCDAGCPIHALANPLVTYLPRAEAAGAIFRTGVQIIRISADANGRGDAFHYRDAKGDEFIQPAKTLVLAGAAVQNARLLLASPSARHPQGFGNSSGLVGCFLSAHSLANVYALFEEDTECDLGLTAGALTCQDGYDKIRNGPFGSYTWGIAPALKPNDLIGIANTRPDLFGEDLVRLMHHGVRHMGVMNAICESVPQRVNRVELAADTDAFGMPLARITHTLDGDGLGLWKHAQADGIAVMQAAGAREAWVGPVLSLAHISGGTIMGEDPATSVTNAFGLLHDVPNVIVAGAGLMPTTGAVSPTFTVLALAERTATHLLAQLVDHKTPEIARPN